MHLSRALTRLLCGLAAFAVCATSSAADGLAPSGRWTADHRGAAKTPPMGWNSWNAFRTEVDEAKVMGAAQKLVDSGLAKLGYTYVNIDDGWWLKRRQSDGRLEIRTAIFPSAAIPGQDTSFRPHVERLHAMGLKAGIYTDIGRNACSQAWDLDSPNLPVGTPEEREVGLEGHVEQDLKLFFEEWGFDYVKIDACGLADFGPGSKVAVENGYRPREPLIVRPDPSKDRSDVIRGLYETVSAALARLRPKADYVLSLCTWGRGDVRRWGHKVGNLWRTSPDIGPRWSSMLRSYDSVATRALYAGPGHWNDPDMLFIGAGDFDANHLTEARSHFAVWSMVNAPLLIGYDLRNAPQSLLDIWGNADLIAINQDPLGNQAVIADRQGEAHVLVKALADGRKAVAVFNRANQPRTVTLTAAHLKLDAGKPVTLKNLWTKETLAPFTGQTTFTVASHETLVFAAAGAPVLANGIHLSEMPGLVHIAHETVPADQPPAGTEWAQYAGWGGAQADASPYSTPLAVAGRPFRYGLGVLAGSRLEVLADRRFARFAATVGVDDATRDRSAEVTFEVWGDGRLLQRTAALGAGDAPVEIAANIRGVKVVELVVRSDGAATPAATWGDARFER